MAFPLTPPPITDTGATTWPRTLWRWLDDNPVGQLTRAYTYIQLPTFNQGANTWAGYSTIVAAFNFEGPNNISLKAFTKIVNPNYVLCISYRVQGVLTRYLLWDAVGSKMPYNVTPYVSQPILKNFRLEIWNTSQGQASEAVGATIYTSKLQGSDYRYAADAALVGNDGQVSSFGNINTLVSLPTAGINQRWTPSGMTVSGGTTLVSWKDDTAGTVITPTGLTEVLTDPIINLPVAWVVTGAINGTAVGNTTLSFAILFQIITLPSGTVNLFSNGNGATLSVTAAHKLYSFGDNTGNTALVANRWYLAICSGVSGITYLIDPITGVQLDTFSGSSSVGPDGTVSLGSANMVIADVTTFTSDALSEYYTLTGYYGTKYFSGTNLSLPLTFPSNAVSQTN